MDKNTRAETTTKRDREVLAHYKHRGKKGQKSQGTAPKKAEPGPKMGWVTPHPKKPNQTQKWTTKSAIPRKDTIDTRESPASGQYAFSASALGEKIHLPLGSCGSGSEIYNAQSTLFHGGRQGLSANCFNFCAPNIVINQFLISQNHPLGAGNILAKNQNLLAPRVLMIKAFPTRDKFLDFQRFKFFSNLDSLGCQFSCSTVLKPLLK